MTPQDYIKELAPRLPYGLKVKWYDMISELDSMRVDGFNSDGEQIKPIYRPLSDLTDKLIDVLWFDVISTDSDSYDKDDFYEMCELGSINHLPYKVVQWLLEHHFDINGWIDKELAIDVNTLEVNPYK